VTGGSMRIGWNVLNNSGAIGEDQFSLGYDGAEGVVVQNSISTKPANELPRWKPGDVIGCSIDMVNRKFELTLNGKPIQPATDLVFSADAEYKAAVTLAPYQQ